jgi:predicted O-methyltransferase YrrM
MRQFRHWTPRYIMSRLADAAYQRACPDHPWLTRTANQILASCLRKSDIGLEFGSGRSTLWFARRTQHLTSVEHDESWHKRVRDMLDESRQDNVDYHLFPMDAPEDLGGGAAYVKVLERFETESLDYVLVDGMYRDFCALNSLPKIRSGGVLIIDNANWYLPSDTWSPASRTVAQGPKGSVWGSVHQSLLGWRRVWTSSGVTDTALYFKP